MEFNLEIAGLLEKKDLSDREKGNLLRLFKFTQYLLDDDNNLTKSLNLAKKARDQLEAQMVELFEGGLTAQEDQTADTGEIGNGGTSNDGGNE